MMEITENYCVGCEVCCGCSSGGIVTITVCDECGNTDIDNLYVVDDMIMCYECTKQMIRESPEDYINELFERF